MPTAHRAPRKHSLRGWFQGGGMLCTTGGYNNHNDHPAGIAGTPPQRGTLARDGT